MKNLNERVVPPNNTKDGLRNVKEKMNLSGNDKLASQVKADIKERLEVGGVIYKKPDMDQQRIESDPRDWLSEAYEEALDLVVYLYCAIRRRDGN